jgi:predicted Zn-dependent protease with MMP-like domain
MARRDRHGRGLRGPLVLEDLPVAGTRRRAFAALVAAAADRLEEYWADEWGEIIVAVEDLPHLDPGANAVPAAVHSIATSSGPATVVLYRRIIEDRGGPDDVAAEVRDVLAEEVGALLGLPPEDVDPDYGT